MAQNFEQRPARLKGFCISDLQLLIWLVLEICGIKVQYCFFQNRTSSQFHLCNLLEFTNVVANKLSGCQQDWLKKSYWYYQKYTSTSREPVLAGTEDNNSISEIIRSMSIGWIRPISESLGTGQYCFCKEEFSMWENVMLHPLSWTCPRCPKFSIYSTPFWKI